MSTSTPVFALENASFGYGAPVVAPLSLTVAPGQRLAVVGPNGAGKSTLMRGLIGLLPALGGRALLQGRDLRSMRRDEVARVAAYLPQDVRPPTGLSALEVVLLGRAAHRRGGPAAWTFDAPDDVEHARAALADVGVEALASRPFQTLSGGERRLVLVAQVIALAASAVVLDEPTSALDLRAQERVCRTLVDASEKRGLAVVVVTHDLGLAARLAPRLLLLAAGKAVAHGASADVLVPDVLTAAFGLPLAVSHPEGAGAPVVFARRAP